MTAPSAATPDERAADFRRLRGLGLLPLDGDLYPVVHYPGITMYPPGTEEELFAGYAPPPGGRVSLYVHVPFCSQYCNFCHYPVVIGASDAAKEEYVAALAAEAALYRRRLGLDRPKTTSVLVGGGTPTCLPPRLLERFLGDLAAQFDLSGTTQFSYDVDPGTLLGPDGAERLRILRAHGVGRLTIGIQSFDDGVLRRMNRAHDAAAALRAVDAARAAGFKLNVEFIYGYPGDTMETWTATMRRAVRLPVEEIQIYRIKLIPYGDHAGFFSRGGAAQTPTEEVFRMKQAAIVLLGEAGWRENLRRVYSKDPAEYSRYAHDQCCGLADQVGLGLTAFSSLRDRFLLPTRDLKEYYALIAAGKLPVNRGLVRGAATQAAWAFVLPLKNRRVIKGQFRRISGRAPGELFGKRIARLKEAGLLFEDDAKVELTPLGAFFADEVCHQFYEPRYLPFGREAYAAGPLNPYSD